MNRNIRMNDRRRFGAAVFVLGLSLLIALLNIASAAGNADRVIRLQTGDVVLREGVFETGGGRYVVVELERLLSRAEQDDLAASGVRLLSWLGDTIFIAGIDPGALDATSGRFGIHAAAPWGPANKATAAMRGGEVLDWARTDGGRLRLSVLFFGDMTAAEMEAALGRHAESYRLESPPLLWAVEIAPGELDALLREQGIHIVEPGPIPFQPTLDDVRKLIHADEVQQATIGQSDIQYAGLTGEGIRLRVSEGAWDGHPDFFTNGALRFVNSDPDWGGNHGTMVGGIMAGDGELSATLQGTPYYGALGLWRGVAPEATLTEFENNDIDASNHSYVMSYGEYDSDAVMVDSDVRGDYGPENQWPQIWAAANNGGLTPQYDNEEGYYSIYTPAKNNIVVGSVNAGDASLSDFSSLGPTFDGRIKPDVMAPGGDIHLPPDFDLFADRVQVTIDYIRIVNSRTGNTDKAWEFNSPGDAEGWFETDSKYNIFDVGVSGGSLSFKAGSWPDGVGNQSPWGWNEELNLVADPDHVINMRYKMSLPDGSTHSIMTLWFHQQNFPKAISGDIDLATVIDGGWQVTTVPVGQWGLDNAGEFGGWSGTMTKIGMVPFWHNYPGTTAPAYYGRRNGVDLYSYTTSQGTSFAAPVATGSVALILQQFRDALGIDLAAAPPLPSTIKALLVQTADDLVHAAKFPRDQNNPDTGAPVLYHVGPDFATGYGLINVKAAVDLVGADPGPAAARYIHEGELGVATHHIYDFTLTGDQIAGLGGTLKFTLAWDDFPGDPALPQTTPRLVNDLDLFLIAPDGALHYPWTLDPLPVADCGGDGPGCGDPDPIAPEDVVPARREPDHRNNVEMVEVWDAMPGQWQAVVVATFVPMPNQIYSLVGNVLSNSPGAIGEPEPMLSAGQFHACALSPSGAVDCWGDNSDGQAADRSGPYTQVSAGAYHTCALSPSGAVDCWGDNGKGQAASRLGPYTQVSAGVYHTCALFPSGAVDCWGDNALGQATDQPGPYLQISASWVHTCGLTPSGAVDCWGDNSYGQSTGQLGPYVEVSAGRSHTCAQTPDWKIDCWGWNKNGQDEDQIGLFIQLSAGWDHNCGLTPSGAADCWGLNGDGQAIDRPGPYLQLSSGAYFTCGMTASGSVDCWGNNDNGQAENQPGPYGPYGLHGPAILAAGDDHSCGLRPDGRYACWGGIEDEGPSTDHGTLTELDAGFDHVCGLTVEGKASCWGANDLGQGTGMDGPFIQVAAGSNFNCGLKPNGSVDCWGGDNDYGETEDQSGPFTALAAGTNHVCALEPGGRPFCWGTNKYGQTDAPDGPFIQISAGWDHTCGLTPSGGVACWGWNGYRQVESRFGPYVQVSAGMHHACALRPNGRVECWGWNGYSQAENQPGPYTQIIGGGRHTCGLTADGRAECWGDDESGQSEEQSGPFGPYAPPPPNTAPVAADKSVTTALDTPLAVTLAATDADGDPLTYAVVKQPQHGTLTGGGKNRTYTPAAGYTGPDSFTFKANDGEADSNVATVSITVTPAPVWKVFMPFVKR